MLAYIDFFTIDSHFNFEQLGNLGIGAFGNWGIGGNWELGNWEIEKLGNSKSLTSNIQNATSLQCRKFKIDKLGIG